MMNTDRIEEIQKACAYPESHSVQQALLQVWNECEAASRAKTTEAFECAAQLCRYYLKHQNFPSRWEGMSEYERGVTIACESLEKIILEEIAK